jgi:hypothetical protein
MIRHADLAGLGTRHRAGCTSSQQHEGVSGAVGAIHSWGPAADGCGGAAGHRQTRW